MIKAILFDFGEVFVTCNSKDAENELREKYGISLLRSALTQPYFDFVRGDITTDDYFKKILECNSDVTKKLSIKELRRIYSGLYIKYSEPDESMYRLSRDLHNKYSIVCVSDMNQLHKELNESEGYFDVFDKVFFSCKTNKLKRDPKYFSEVLEKLNLTAKEVIFVDDQAINVNTAREQGIISIKFTSTHKLLAKFSKLGIKLL